MSLQSGALSKVSLPKTPVQAIVLGASAGAVEALSELLPPLKPGYPIPIIAVVHSPPDRESAIVDLFRFKCRLKIKEAEDKELIRPGIVYFAPPDYHLLVEKEHRLALSSEEPVMFCRPAINLLFESAADAYGPGLLGIVLTGANADGAQGLAALCAAGGTGIVQEPALALMPTMPRAAMEACRGAYRLDLNQIALLLQRLPTWKNSYAD